jgi:hypothetical protein
MEIVFATFLGDETTFYVEEPDEAGWRKVTWGGVEIGVIHTDGVQLAVFVEPESTLVLPEDDRPKPWEHAAHRPLLLRQVQAHLRNVES